MTQKGIPKNSDCEMKDDRLKQIEVTPAVSAKQREQQRQPR